MVKERIQIIKGDITLQEVDAVVNAANSSLMGGGGVDGAIHRRGGPAILEECKEIIRQIGACATGQAVITTAGKLPAKFVIHTVGPVFSGARDDKAADLIRCYRNSLSIARDKKLHSIAFPNISTGVYNYPKDEAAAIAVHAGIDWVLENAFPHQIIFCCFDDENFNWMSYFLDVYLKQDA